MIKVNLLGEEIVSDSSDLGMIYGYCASVVAMLALCGWLYYSTSSSITELNDKKGSLETQLVKLEEVTKEVKELESKKRLLNDKLSVIARLRLNKRGPVRVFDDLNVAIPSNLWISEFKEAAGILQISGLALDNAPIVDFMKNLEKSEYFRTVELGDSTQVYLVRVLDKSGSSGTRGADASRAGRGAAMAKSAGSDLAHKVMGYTTLSKEQRDAFDRDKFGAGVKLRSFTIKCAITYIGKTALKAVEEAQAKLEAEAKEKEAAEKKAKATPKKKPEAE